MPKGVEQRCMTFRKKKGNAGMRKILEHNKICAIMRNIPMEKTIPYAEAVYRGGIRLFEVAMNSDGGAKQIQLLRRHFGDKAYVGAGTVINLERCEAAKSAGAQFFLTPSASVVTLEYCRKNEIPLLPGVLTPTDVAVCLEYGYHVMKLFPAGDMPAGYIRSLKGPFDGTDYVAVGGVRADNIRSFFDHGFIGVGIGGNLVRKEYIAANEWDKATDFVRGIVKMAE